MTLAQLDAASMSHLRTRRDRLAEEASVMMLATQGSGKELSRALNDLRGIKPAADPKDDLASALGIPVRRKGRK